MSQCHNSFFIFSSPFFVWFSVIWYLLVFYQNSQVFQDMKKATGVNFTYATNEFPIHGYDYYRPQTKLRKGNVFTNVCQEFCWWGGGGVWQTPPPGRHPLDRLGRHPPGRHLPGQAPPGRHPPRQTRQTPPPPADGYCSGRYASYWNAFFL